MNSIKHAIAKFSQEEDGAQVVEYALIIAVVSIVLVLALGNNTSGLGAKFAALITRIGHCLDGTAGC
jgi:pilus assembly protein Flp/PilA